MTNIFLFRHGKCVNSDSDKERLTQEGLQQAIKAGEIVAETLKKRYFYLQEHCELERDEVVGILKANSGTTRTASFLEVLFVSAGEKFNGRWLGSYGDAIEIRSSKIYDSSEGSKKIRQIITQCSPLCGIQIIVGHNPGVARSVEDYVKEGFKYHGDERFLKSTLEGGGYYINTLEKTIQAINQP